MKFDKGLYTDCLETDQPAGTYRFAKNIVDTEVFGALENEYGFEQLGQVTPVGLNIIGVIPVRDALVVFLTDNVNSEIGIIDSTQVYTQVYSNPGLNFDTSAPIKGEYRKDITGGRIVAWIDDINSPRILNIDDLTGIDDVSDLEIFPDVTNPTLTVPVINDAGGSLPTGAIIPITQYKSADGSTTNWFVHDFVFYINDEAKTVGFNLNDGAAPETTSNKSITFTLTGNDTDFDVINIGYILSVNNILTPFKVAELTNSTTLTVTITGNESAIEVPIDEIVTPTATYNNAKAITQLAGRLYLGNLSTPPLPELQATAMDIRIDYRRDLINVISNTGSHKDVLPPTFMPGEVYAFYFGVEMKKGGWNFYHIPGREAVVNDKDLVTSEGMTYRRFQVENTSDKVGAYSTMGYWENSGENYPDDLAYVGPITGDQRNTPVRHHRFPLLGHVVDTYYAANTSVGMTQLPRFGIDISNVNIPAELQNDIVRWKIFFAKKEITNSLVQGSDLLQFGVDRDGRIQSSGGNWKTRRLGSAVNTVNKGTLRGHCLDMYFNNKTATPTYFQTHYKLRRHHINQALDGFRGIGGALAISVADVSHTAAAVIDFTVPLYTTRASLRKTKSLSNFTYLPENSLQNNFSTESGTGEFVANINTVGTDLDSITLIAHSIYNGIGDSEQFYYFGGGTDADVGEETAYMQYFNLLSSVHNAFQSQELIPTVGYAYPFQTAKTAVYGGDSFMCYMSYLAASPGQPFSTSKGVRMWKSYIGYSRYNFNYRYETPGTIGTFYYGKTDPKTLFSPPVGAPPIIAVNDDSVVVMTEPQNIVNYTEDYNRLNNFIVGVIDHPTVINQTEFPNTIVYSPVQQEESLEFSWRVFRAGDRAVVGQNRGDIINLQGFRNKELIIHTEDSLFRTRTDLQVAASQDTENIFFQSASLFELPPEELLPANSGYAGTQHKFACKLSKVGYLFPDNKQGKIFLYNGQGIEEISSNGMRTFFRDFMKESVGDNPFVGTGYNIDFDERLNRVIVSKKNEILSWTISYNPQKKTWVSFHDYVPDYLCTDNKGNLFSFKDNLMHLNSAGSVNTLKGVFYGPTVYSSFIDTVFNQDLREKKTFQSVSWVTESYPSDSVNGQPSTQLEYNNTFTHLTMRSADSCTGRINLARIGEIDTLYEANVRNVGRVWYYDDIRNIVISPGFITGFYDDYAVDSTKLNTNMEWYDRRRFNDYFLTCRFEYDNVVNKRLLFVENNISYSYGR